MYETEVPGAEVEPVTAAAAPARPVRRWPLAFIGAPAAVAVWSGWVGLGQMCGFGIIHPLPGIVDSFQINTAITLPIGVEAYGAYALGVGLRPGAVSPAARAYARRSAVGALVLGMAGQVIYHLLAAAHATKAPWPVVMLVSCLPVAAIGLGAALTHLLHDAAPVRAPEPVRSAAAFPRVDTAPVRDGIGPERTAPPAPVREQAPAPAVSAPARTDAAPLSDAPLAEADRAAVVEMVADQIRDAVEADEVWRPDYAELGRRYGRRRSWCEKVVRDARALVMTPPPDPDDAEGDEDRAGRTGAVHRQWRQRPRTDGPEPYADEDRTEELAIAGTS